MKFQF